MSEIVQGIETCINARWENGVDHHPESEKLIRILSQLDGKLLRHTLDISTGGDGDNGETMMYLLDVYFEALDKGIDINDILKEIKP
jgi:hypothetical protein